ncbi:lysostaphin resistance A-like protein [Microbacterium sp. 179-I 3D2 NHS]|uniref:CPBP family intramembrane glutamic endopeptidase n=1 Tax=Microbacterium sp. 179-I 3D2 NHS TaxID=3235178 RepID=UPI00399F64F9
MTSEPALRASRADRLALDARALRPTVVLAAIYVFVWLIAPFVEFIAPAFGGSRPESHAGDVFGLLGDQSALADYFFSSVAFSIILIAAVITVLRWWRIIQFEPTPLRPRAFAVLPWLTTAAFALAVIIGIAATPNPSASLVALQAVAMLGIVFVEEIGWRGVAVVGLRGSRFPEWSVWLITSAGFALMHLLNLVGGADIESTVFQLVFTFLLGTACYLGRRAGGLWLAVAVHFTNNFLQAAAQGSVDSPLFGVVNALALVGQILLLLSLPATIVLLVLEARRARRGVASAGDRADAP